MEITTLNKPVFKKHQVIHYGVANVASRVAHTATTALSNILYTYSAKRCRRRRDRENMAQRFYERRIYL